MKISDVKPLPTTLPDETPVLIPVCVTRDDLNLFVADYGRGTRRVGGWLTLIAWLSCKPQNVRSN